MSGKLDINVDIAGRKYSMSIDASKEEVIRRAAKAINSRISSYQSRKLVEDPIDYLAMAALQISIENETVKMNDDATRLTTRLEQIDSELAHYLSDDDNI